MGAAAEIIGYFFGEEKEKIWKMLRQNKISEPESWLKWNFYSGIAVAIAASVILYYAGIKEEYILASFFIIMPVPLLLNFFWVSYLAELRRKNIEACTSDVLLYASSLPKGSPMQKIISSISEAGYGPLSAEFSRAKAEIEKGVGIPEALIRISERNNSAVLKRAIELLVEAYYSGADMKDAFREVAKDILETESILRERASSMIIEKYTLLFSAGIILPAVLAMVSRLVKGLDFELLSRLEIGLDKFRHPAAVVGLDRKKNNVEFRVGRREFAKMAGTDRNLQFRVCHSDSKPLRLHRFDVFGPLIDDRGIVTRLGEIGADDTTDGTCAQNGDLLVHVISL